MSFFSEKVLKRPPLEEIKGYSPRELEIAKKNYNYGHNVCFYTVMVCFIIWAILCSVFRPDVAHASELVGGDEPIETPYDRYFVLSVNDGYVVYVNYSISGNRFNSYGGGFSNFDDVVSALKNGTVSGSHDIFELSPSSVLYNYDVIYCSEDIDWNGKSFPRTPYLIHQEKTVGGLAAPEIAKAIMIQILGLVPLVLGLVISAIGLRKALAMVFQRLRRA